MSPRPFLYLGKWTLGIWMLSAALLRCGSGSDSASAHETTSGGAPGSSGGDNATGGAGAGATGGRGSMESSGGTGASVGAGGSHAGEACSGDALEQIPLEAESIQDTELSSSEVCGSALDDSVPLASFGELRRSSDDRLYLCVGESDTFPQLELRSPEGSGQVYFGIFRVCGHDLDVGDAPNAFIVVRLRIDGSQHIYECKGNDENRNFTGSSTIGNLRDDHAICLSDGGLTIANETMPRQLTITLPDGHAEQFTLQSWPL